MKTLNNILEQSKMYMTGDTERFVKKHAVDTKKLDKPSEDDKLFKATNIKQTGRETELHGYEAGSDEAVYEDVEQVDEKTLTPAELKKREQIAKAMERETPGMDKSKKMAIATATAKRVAEDVQLDERVVHDQYNEYHGSAKDCLDTISKHLDSHKKAVMSGTPWNKEKGSNTSEWHVSQVKGLHRQLQDIADNLQRDAEYAQPPKPVKIKEEVELNEEIDSADFLSVILEGFETEEEREEFLSLIETEEGCAEVLAMIDEAIAEAAAEE